MAAGGDKARRGEEAAGAWEGRTNERN